MGSMTLPAWSRPHAMTVSPPSFASTSESLTETILETPFSSIVTPNSTSAWFMVGLRCVMTMNCVSLENFFRYFAKRSTFASSSAASISSRIQNGMGRDFKMANRMAIAVKARSPPERREILVSFFPGGQATISMPALSGSSQSV